MTLFGWRWGEAVIQLPPSTEGDEEECIRLRERRLSGGWRHRWARPPADRAELLDFVAALAPGHATAALRSAEPLGDVAQYRIRSNRWRRYDKLVRQPAGLLAFGDAICSCTRGRGVARLPTPRRFRSATAVLPQIGQEDSGGVADGGRLRFGAPAGAGWCGCWTAQRHSCGRGWFAASARRCWVATETTDRSKTSSSRTRAGWPPRGRPPCRIPRRCRGRPA